METYEVEIMPQADEELAEILHIVNLTKPLSARNIEI
jgi:hypothetical protein